jgi:hypothetical protein
MKIESSFDLREKVHIDGDAHLIAVVTAVTWRAPDVINYEVSWVTDGDSKSCVIEGWRLTAVGK